jgi:hypothetical protein
MKRRKSEGIFPSQLQKKSVMMGRRTRFSEKMLDLTVTPRSLKRNGTTRVQQTNYLINVSHEKLKVKRGNVLLGLENVVRTSC